MSKRREPEIRTKVLVREVMNTPITASSSTRIPALVAKMADHNIGSVIITEGDKPLGIVTERDIVIKVATKDVKPTQITAEEIMSKPLQMIDSEKDVVEAVRLLRKHNVKRLGVSHRGKLVGIVTMSDLLSVTPELYEIISEKARMMTGETRKQPGYVEGYCDHCTQWSDLLLESDGKFLCEECRMSVTKEE